MATLNRLLACAIVLVFLFLPEWVAGQEFQWLIISIAAWGIANMIDLDDIKKRIR